MILRLSDIVFKFFLPCTSIFKLFANFLFVDRKRSDGTGSCRCHRSTVGRAGPGSNHAGAGKTGNGPGWATLGGWALRQAQLRDWLLAGETQTILMIPSLDWGCSRHLLLVGCSHAAVT